MTSSRQLGLQRTINKKQMPLLENKFFSCTSAGMAQESICKTRSLTLGYRIQEILQGRAGRILLSNYSPGISDLWLTDPKSYSNLFISQRMLIVMVSNQRNQVPCIWGSTLPSLLSIMFYSCLEKWHLVPEALKGIKVRPIAAPALGQNPV